MALPGLRHIISWLTPKLSRFHYNVTVNYIVLANQSASPVLLQSYPRISSIRIVNHDYQSTVPLKTNLYGG